MRNEATAPGRGEHFAPPCIRYRGSNVTIKMPRQIAKDTNASEMLIEARTNATALIHHRAIEKSAIENLRRL
jgi:hypothetical protein